MRNLRIVLCTGIDKACKLELLRKVQACASASGKGQVHVYDLWESIRKVAESKGYSGSRIRITDLPPEELELLRELACVRVAEDFDTRIRGASDRSWHVALLHTRTISPRRSGFVKTLDKTQLALDPEDCWSVIDNVESMHANLLNDPVWSSHVSNLDQVLDRRQEEIANTEHWCDENIGSRHHYLIAAKESPETLLGLLFPLAGAKEKKGKVYLSFPITHADEKIKKRKQEFVARLRQHYVVFDPFSVTEYDVAFSRYQMANASAEKQSQRAWLEKLGAVTVDNDYRLVKQSDGVVVFYPSMAVKVEDSNGEWIDAEQKILSAGVMAEMIYASRLQRTVEALWLSDKVPSPFFTQHCSSPVFKSEEEFFKHLG